MSIIVRHHPNECRIGDKVEKCIIDSTTNKSRWEVVGYVSRQGEGTHTLFTYRDIVTKQECLGQLDFDTPFFVSRET